MERFDPRGGNVEFNLQTFLSDMRAEQLRSQELLTAKVDAALDKMHDHEARIVVVENMRKNMRWLTGTFIGTMITAILTFVFGLFHK